MKKQLGFIDGNLLADSFGKTLLLAAVLLIVGSIGTWELLKWVWPFVKAFLIGFFTTLLICAGLAWLSGYNFDYRSPNVALSAGLSILVAAIVGGFMAIAEDNK